MLISSFILQLSSTNSASILITCVLNSASDRLSISLSLSTFFWSFDLFCHWGHISFSQHTCYVVWGLSLRCTPELDNPLCVLWQCLWGRGQRRNNATHSLCSTPLSNQLSCGTGSFYQLHHPQSVLQLKVLSL